MENESKPISNLGQGCFHLLGTTVLGKGMNPSFFLLSPAMGKIDQIRLLCLGEETNLEEQLKLKPPCQYIMGQYS